MTKIAILDDYQNVAADLADWRRLDAEITVFNDHVDDGDALVERLRGFAIVCAMRERTPFPRTLLERLPDLRLIATAGMKNAAIDVRAATELGIMVCGTPSPGHATAELTWGLILALLRRIPAEERALRAGAWQQALGRDARGKTLGVIGLGRLGEQVARFGKAFGMTVIGWSQNLSDERAAECHASRVEKDQLLAQSDVVTIHLRLSERSTGLIGSRELALMKPSAYLVNTSRGPIVDQTALIDALQNERIAGAALDVYDQEPLPADHPLLGLAKLDNVVLTPHIGFVTEETYRAFYGGMVEAIAAYLQGSPIRRLDS